MDFLSLAQSRYTTKKYDAAQKVSDEEVARLQEILRLCPSSISSQPWQFLFVSTPATKKALAEVSFFNETKIMASDRLVVFTVLDDVARFEEQIERSLPEGSIDYYRRMKKPHGEDAVKAWMQRQVYISLGFFLSACASMGIDSTPMEGIDTAAYDRILQLDGYKTLFAVTLGHRAEDDYNRLEVSPKQRLPLEQVVRTV